MTCKREQAQLEATAYHEACHAIVARAAEPPIKFGKISIKRIGDISRFVELHNAMGNTTEADIILRTPENLRCASRTGLVLRVRAILVFWRPE